ncbi:MAG: YihY/virulence factor BrkB family protein [Acidobacteriia bacterium]|nr:YihY/virulence factor BrkB family protein [Terriglobia bacterium]
MSARLRSPNSPPFTLRTAIWLLRRSLVAAFEDNCFSIAKGAAYSALLSFFPVLTSAAAILIQTRAEFVSNAIESFLSEIVPPGTEDLVLRQFRVAGARPTALLVGAGVISLWAASSVIKSLMEGFQAAYRVPRSRGFLRRSGVAVALVLLAAVPLVGASLLILFGNEVERLVLRGIQAAPWWKPPAWVWPWLSHGFRYAVALATTVLVTALLYYFGPYRRQRWRYVWPGAILATLLWLAATSGFGWYVRHMGNYNVMYGSVGAGIALLVWMYLLAAIALIGCEFNAEYERSGRS